MKALCTAAILSVMLLFHSCQIKHTPRVETFQLMETYWDQTLHDDMKREATTINTIDFIFNVAHSAEEQTDQIRSAVMSGVDAIVINPTEDKSLISVIDEAYDAGVYVILVGQTLPTYKYHAYAGINNTALGKKSATLVCDLLDSKGNILVVGTDSKASFYLERHEAFTHLLNLHPDVNIVGEINGQWDNKLTHKLMDSIKVVLHDTPVDLVFSFGSMIMGAIKSETYPNSLFVGTDGVPGECLEAVKYGLLQASFYCPTGGKEAINTAVCLIKGLPYKKDNLIQPTLITSANAELFENSFGALNNYEQKIDILSTEIGVLNKTAVLLRLILLFSVFLVFVFIIMLVNIRRKSKKRKKTLDELQLKVNQWETTYHDMSIQKEIAEKMRSELEQERDALNNAGFSSKEEEKRDVISEAIFMKKFRETVEKHIDNSNYTIDQLAGELGVSRAHLFRKIKAESGATPNDLLLSIRLEKAKQLLQSGVINVSEVADSVGFSSPSYFSKCYKDKYGISPRELLDKNRGL